jgi:hypothetical protein
VTDPTDGSPIFTTGGDVEALDAQALSYASIYIVARIAAATSVGMELDLQMRQALADIINKLRPEDTRH